MVKGQDNPDFDIDSESDVAVKEEYAQAPLFHVVMHNDDFTTMDFVVFILVEVFAHDLDKAVAVMMSIHHEGRAIVATLPKEIGEMKIAITEQYAQEADYPLMLTFERA